MEILRKEGKGGRKLNLVNGNDKSTRNYGCGDKNISVSEKILNQMN
jgi:hypothetical protein